MSEQAQKKRFTPAEAALELGCTISTMRDIIARQLIGSYKIGGRRFLRREDLDTYQAERTLLPLGPPPSSLVLAKVRGTDGPGLVLSQSDRNCIRVIIREELALANTELVRSLASVLPGVQIPSASEKGA